MKIKNASLLIINIIIHRVYTEELPGDAGIMLFIKDLNQEDSGEYICQGTYANNEDMKSKVKITTFSEYYHQYYDTYFFLIIILRWR